MQAQVTPPSPPDHDACHLQAPFVQTRHIFFFGEANKHSDFAYPPYPPIKPNPPVHANNNECGTPRVFERMDLTQQEGHGVDNDNGHPENERIHAYPPPLILPASRPAVPLFRGKILHTPYTVPRFVHLRSLCISPGVGTRGTRESWVTIHDDDFVGLRASVFWMMTQVSETIGCLYKPGGRA